jgi:Domain of unknown function (DUF4157)
MSNQRQHRTERQDSTRDSDFGTPQLEPQRQGQTLDAETRAALEPKFEHNFGNVRVFADEQADQLAKGYEARAFTVGQNVFFSSGQYRPGTPDGMRLLAHELTHTIQQAQGRVAPTHGAGVSVDPSPDLEAEAVRSADAFADSSSAQSHPRASQHATTPISAPPSSFGNGSGAAVVQRDPTITVPPVVISSQAPGPVTISPVTIYGEAPQQVANTTIVGDATPGAYTREIEQAMNRLADKADVNAVKYAQQVQFAFDAFQNYADAKLGDMSITEDDVCEFIVGKGIEAIAGQVTGALTGGIGATIGGFVIGKVKDKLLGAAKLDKSGKLKDAIRLMGQIGRDGATAIQSAVKEKVYPLVAGIRTKVASATELTKPEQDFVDQFTYVEDPAMFSAAIAQLGIPDTTDAATVQLTIYQALVEAFEMKYILANASWGQQISYGAAAITGDDSHSLNKDAKLAAQQASDARGKELRSKP